MSLIRMYAQTIEVTLKRAGTAALADKRKMFQVWYITTVYNIYRLYTETQKTHQTRFVRHISHCRLATYKSLPPRGQTQDVPGLVYNDCS